MSFIEKIKEWEGFDFTGFSENTDSAEIPFILEKKGLDPLDFLKLLSPAARPHLEAMARKAHRLSVQYFGRVIQLYIPLYLSNYCSNECLYCGFSVGNKIHRKKLSLEELGENARAIAGTGMRHLLILTGEAPSQTPLAYLLDCVSILKQHFDSLSIEIFPMDTPDYARLKQAGVDGLTLYQEVYDRDIYARVHPAGRKADYDYRLSAPERGAEAGFRTVNIGALFGLGQPLSEAFFTGLHAHYLHNKYIETEFSVSLPRLNEAEGDYQALYRLDDASLVQTILAYRLFLPRVGITLSTREGSTLRDNLIPLGVTRMSAGSVTTVGGYGQPGGGHTPQFEIDDERSVAEVARAISSLGYEPVFKDWEMIG